MLGVSSNSTTNTPLTAGATDTGSVVKNGDGSTVVTSPGGDVVGTHSNPLPVVAIPVAALPDYVAVSANLPGGSSVWSAGIASAGAWTAQIVETGRAIIDLDGDYRLSINDVLAEVILENRTTNVTTRIWGNAQVEVAGQEVGQFWGTSSFELANGTLITAKTIVSPDNSSAFMLDRLVITRDDRGFVVAGISNEVVGDLAITYAANATVYEHLPAAEPTMPSASVELSSAPVVEAAVENQVAAVPETVPAAVAEGVAEAPVKMPVVAAENGATKPVDPVKPIEAVPAVTEGGTKDKPVAAATIEAPVVTPVDNGVSNSAPVAAAPESSATPAPITTAPVTPAVEQPATTPIAATPQAPTPTPTPAPVKMPVLVENSAANIAAIRERIDGYDMDDDQRDGLVFVETATGWIDEWDDKQISAEVLAQTMIGAEFGPDSTIMSRSEFGAVISRFISILTTQGMMSQIANSNSMWQNQLRDSAIDSDRQASARQASERAARDRQIVLNMIHGGTGANATLNRGSDGSDMR